MQVTTGIFVVLFVLQVMVVQLLSAFAVCGVQVVTPTGPTTILPQVVATNPLPAVGATVVHDPTGVGPVRMVGPTQVVDV